jgi:hypothetical protein
MIYSRHSHLDAKTADSITDAIYLQQFGTDEGELYDIGIFDSEKNIVYLPDDDLLDDNQRLTDIRKACNLNPEHEFNDFGRYG